MFCPETKLLLDLQKGAAALLTIVIIGAATLLMAMTAAFLGIGDLELAFTSQQGRETLALGEGCLEETLRRIRLDTNYGLSQGQLDLTFANGTCIIEITDLGGNRRQIDVESTHAEYAKKLRAEISLEGNVITLDAWKVRSD